ncbi:MAG TPA: PilZ domain-containing protein [Gammaproteobacteria bacterium]|nr:PilZ domain-containing protein [Gammaproteobacteria bacterium]
MERRWSQRVPFEADVTIYLQGVPVLSCKSRNIGPEGLLIDTEADSLPVQRAVEVEIRLDEPGHKQRLRIPAYVTRTKTGVAMMFTGTDPNTPRVIKDLMRHSREALTE